MNLIPLSLFLSLIFNKYNLNIAVNIIVIRFYNIIYVYDI